MRTKLRMAGRDHVALSRHLFPSDGKEAIAFALCGSSVYNDEEVVTVHKIYPVPHDTCTRKTNSIRWPADFVVDLLDEAVRKNQRLLKIHSHPTEYPHFSTIDDSSDYAMFRTASEWLDNESPGISAIMFQDGSIQARSVSGEGALRG
jgi:hypothetical protein